MNAPESPKAAAARKHGSGGFIFGLTAYGLWGILPVYFNALRGVPPVDIVAHRVLWSLPFLAFLISVSRGWKKVQVAATTPRTIGILFLTALLVGTNWLLY